MKLSLTCAQRLFPALLGVLACLLATSALAQRPAGDWEVVYEDRVITNALILRDVDNVLFYNCTFQDISDSHYALRLDRCTNVRIQGCTFRDVDTEPGGDLLRLSNCRDVQVRGCELYDHRSEGHSSAIKMSGGSSRDILIANNYIHDVSGNGVLSDGCSSCSDVDVHDVPNRGLRVVSNRIVNTGLFADPSGNSPKHGMYVKAQDALIENNVIRGCHDGSGITVRSTAIVRGNLVTDARDRGIDASFMKPAGPSAEVLIENNVVVQRRDDGPGWGEGIGANCCTSYPKRYDRSIIRFNTVVAYAGATASPYLIRTDQNDRRNGDRVYGNLLVDLRSSTRFIGSRENIEYLSNNYLTKNLDAFVNPAALDLACARALTR